MEHEQYGDENLKKNHEENRQTEAETKREDMNPSTPDTVQKNKGTTSAYSAATGGNAGNNRVEKA